MKQRFFLVTMLISLLIFQSCEKKADNPEENKKEIQIGSVDWGNNANYIVRGQIIDTNGNALVNEILELNFINKIDSLKLKTDSEGRFEYKGLPTLLFEHEFDISVTLVNDKFERTTLWPIAKYNFDKGFPPIETIVIPKILDSNIIIASDIDLNTKISGKILDSIDNPIPKNQIELLDLTKGEYVYVQGPAFNEPDNVDFFYDENTGNYEIENCLSGGNLDYHFHLIFKENSNLQNIEGLPIEIKKGQDNKIDIKIYYKP